MKNVKLKLSLTIIAVIIVLALLAFGIYSIFIGFKYNWNTRVDLEYVPQEVTLRFEAKVNDNENVFISNAADGKFDNSHWLIASEDTTFTKTNQTITISLKFVNKCSSDLLIKINGIHYDSLNRFSTYLTNEQGSLIDNTLITKNVDGTGQFVTTLSGGVDEFVVINLNYTLIETSVPITGTDTDKQYLSIAIDLA